jgi:hypothetical protein
VIQLPSRSVTRFFVPMIDVLTLLFCIYLLMPMVPPSDAAESENNLQALRERIRALEAELARKGQIGEELAADLRKEIEALRLESIKTLQTRLAVRVLQIDGKTGELYFNNPARVDVRDQNDVQQLINRDRDQPGSEKREMYYLILYPRDRDSSHPTREERQRFDNWFQNVAHGYDIPARDQGKKR